MLLTDESKILIKENVPEIPNERAQFAHSMQRVENHVNQLNQKTTMIGNLRKISISNSDAVYPGNMLHYSVRCRTSYCEKRSIMSNTNKGKCFPLHIRHT